MGKQKQIKKRRKEEEKEKEKEKEKDRNFSYQKIRIFPNCKNVFFSKKKKKNGAKRNHQNNLWNFFQNGHFQLFKNIFFATLISLCMLDAETGEKP